MSPKMITRHAKPKIGGEETGQTGVAALEAIQGIIANELSKVQREWQTYKHEIVGAIQKVENKVEQRLQVLEVKLEKIEGSGSQLYEKILAL